MLLSTATLAVIARISGSGASFPPPSGCLGNERVEHYLLLQASGEAPTFANQIIRSHDLLIRNLSSRFDDLHLGMGLFADKTGSHDDFIPVVRIPSTPSDISAYLTEVEGKLSTSWGDSKNQTIPAWPIDDGELENVWNLDGEEMATDPLGAICWVLWGESWNTSATTIRVITLMTFSVFHYHMSEFTGGAPFHALDQAFDQNVIPNPTTDEAGKSDSVRNDAAQYPSLAFFKVRTPYLHPFQYLSESLE